MGNGNHGGSVGDANRATRARMARAATNKAAKAGSKATQTPAHAHTTDVSPQAWAALRHTFGRPLADRTIRAMAGAPPSANVRVTLFVRGQNPLFDPRTGQQYTDHETGRALYSAPSGYRVTWNVEGPPLPKGQHDEYTDDRQYTMARALDLEPNFTVSPRGMYNSHLFIARPSQGQGLGTTAFLAQVQTLSRLGVAQIETHAGRDSDMNGYYTWPQLGYNAPLRPGMLHRALDGEGRGALTPATRARLTAMQRAGMTPQIRDLIATPDGLHFWKTHGVGQEMTFNLNKYGADRRWLARYLRSPKTRAKGLRSTAGWR